MECQRQQEQFKQELTAQSARIESLWKGQKFNLHMEVSDDAEAYTITAYIPGLKRDSIGISTSKEGLSPILAIRGYRSPLLLDIALMRRQLIRGGNEPTDDNIVRFGKGRFGNFLEKFAVPIDVDISEIDANYNAGELCITLPKVHLVHFAHAADQRDFWF